MAKLAGKGLTARGAAANAVAAGRRQSRDLSAEPAGTFLEREDRANPSPSKLLKPLGVAGSAGQAEDIAVDWPKPPIGPQRRSVWHQLRGESIEGACRRIAVKGMLWRRADVSTG